MVSGADIDKTLNKMILSPSGWRGVFAADENEESPIDQISEAHRIFSGAAARIFFEYLSNGDNPLILLGADTRPTGKAIAEAMIPVLLDYGCEVCYAGFTAAPEIMAWARTKKHKTNKQEKSKKTGFIYISASHNPIGHNGLKFGLTDGGVLAADEANLLIDSFRSFLKSEENIKKIESIICSSGSSLNSALLRDVFANINNAKAEAYKAYYDFCNEVVYGSQKTGVLSISDVMKESLAKNPLGIVCDFNGSARTVSIDNEFFPAFGFKFESINDKPGEIVHRIVPEGESLEPCARLLEEANARNSSFILGYVPDCDGDRGNLVIWDDTINRARALEAQEVFALACVAELSHLVWSGDLSYDSNGNVMTKAAVAVNDPTSMRIDRIAGAFGVSVFRAEVGEANVVSLARKLREDGYLVRILGEGSAGGNITHPSAVRDPVNTVIAIAKMISVRSFDERPGLYEIWCKHSGQHEKYKNDFTLADIIASLPPFVTTAAYNKDAVMHIKTCDHAILKDCYQQIFLREWEDQKEQLKARFGFYGWEAIAYNGLTEKRGINRFGESRNGGLKALFFNDEGKEIAYIWMRGSATEPVFRIMADVEGNDAGSERFLLDWQRKMIMNADDNIKE
jgi:phosphoglucomutase